jgi:glutaredoxin
MPPATPVIALTLYSRPGCHLCEEMKAAIDRVAVSMQEPIALEEIDISADPDLEARYGLEIPVLLAGEKKVAKYRVDEGTLKRMLQDQAGRTG